MVEGKQLGSVTNRHPCLWGRVVVLQREAHVQQSRVSSHARTRHQTLTLRVPVTNGGASVLVIRHERCAGHTCLHSDFHPAE